MQATLAGGVGDVGPAAEDGHGPAAALEGPLVRRRVDTHRHPADHGDPGGRQAPTEPARDLAGVLARPARADDRHHRLAGPEGRLRRGRRRLLLALYDLRSSALRRRSPTSRRHGLGASRPSARDVDHGRRGGEVEQRGRIARSVTAARALTRREDQRAAAGRVARVQCRLEPAPAASPQPGQQRLVGEREQVVGATVAVAHPVEERREDREQVGPSQAGHRKRRPRCPRVSRRQPLSCLPAPQAQGLEDVAPGDDGASFEV